MSRSLAFSLLFLSVPPALANSHSGLPFSVAIPPKQGQILADGAAADSAADSTVEILIEAGPIQAGRRFRVIPELGGQVQPRLAPFYDRLFGVSNANGRAVVQFQAPKTSAAGSQIERLADEVEHRIELIGAPGARVATSVTSSAVTGTMSAPGATNFGLPTDVLDVRLPNDGATVGSPSIDVRGRLGGPLNVPGVQVMVNGQAAETFPSAGSFGTFLLANFELSTGANTLTIEASAPSGIQRVRTVDVTLNRQTSNNVVIEGNLAYGARGGPGVVVMDLRSREFTNFNGPPGAGRVDDVAIADGLLFVLDAQSGGNLSVYSLADPESPSLVSGPVSVPIAPFAGVSAGGGRVVVSGGTSLLTVRSYSSTGQLGGAVASIDLGIGQPDVLVSADGEQAFVSTDFSGFFGGAGFGISTIDLNTPPMAPTLVSRTGLVGSGFSAGSQAPANFPIESAVVDGLLVTAHGGGLSRIMDNGLLFGTTSVGFPAVNVDGIDSTAFVAGTGRRVAEVSINAATGAAVLQGTQTFVGPGAFTGVAAHPIFLAIASNAGGLRVVRR